MIRALRPTDVLAYLSFRRQSPDNEALCGADGQTIALDLGTFLGDAIALDNRRAHWAFFERGLIQGLVAVRARFGADVWDVERLMLAPGIEPDPILGLLLDHMLHQATEGGVQKVFLRIRDGSEAFLAARRVGFHCYASERIYSRAAGTIPPDTLEKSEIAIRPRRPAHHQQIFQLYSTVVPATVRQVEGMTLQEWRWTDGWQVGSVPWSRESARRHDFVALESDGVVGWIQIDYQSRLVSLLTSGRDEVAGGLLRYGSDQLGAVGPQHLPLRDYQVGLASIAEALDFYPGDRHLLLARALAIRVPEGKLVPVQAS